MKAPDTMRAVVLTGHGGLDKLVYHEDRATPGPGPDEVLVRVGACGLNNTDINTRSAWYSTSVTEGITIAGAPGGVGSAAIRLCRLRGARDVAIASASKAGQLEQPGADHAIDRDTPDLEVAIADAAGGNIDVAPDVVGGGMFVAKRHIGNIVVGP